MDTEDKLKALEVKIRALELTIEKIKVWVWQVYENEIPDDILALATVSSTISKSNNTGNPTKFIPKLEVTELGANSISAQDSSEPDQEFVLPDYAENELANDPAREASVNSNEDFVSDNLQDFEDHFEPLETSVDNKGDSESISPLNIDKLCEGKSEQDQILIRSCFSSKLVIRLERLAMVEGVKVPRILKTTKKLKRRRKATLIKRRKRSKKTWSAQIQQNTCSFCGLNFQNLKNLNSHLLGVHDFIRPRKSRDFSQKKRTCHICGDLVPDYKQHMLTSHPNEDETPFKCTKCDRGYYSKHRFRYHLNSHKMEQKPPEEDDQNKKACEHCGKQILESKMTYHIYIKHKTHMHNKCNVPGCGKRFPQLREFILHQAKHYYPDGGEYCEEFAKNCPPERVSLFEEHIKRKQLWGFKDLKLPCKFCGELMSNALLKDHYHTKHPDVVGVEDGEKVSCPVPGCGRKIRDWKSMQGHYMVHVDPDSKFYSEEFVKNCPDLVREKLESQMNHKKKRKKERIEEDRKICEICGKDFKYAGTLNQHVKFYHENAGKYVCEICGIVMKRPNHLRDHKKTVHCSPEERKRRAEMAKRTCEICGVRVHRHVMNRHILLKHKKDEQAFECSAPGCGKKFATKFILWEHCHTHLNPRSNIYSEEFERTCPVEMKQYLEKSRKRQRIYTREKYYERKEQEGS